jgi:hypothetical protein
VKRVLLCAAIVAFALLAAKPAAACGSCGGGPFGFFGFGDYRRSLDPNDDPGYRHYRRNLDRDLNYAFHCMTPREASCIVNGGRRGWSRGCDAHAVKKIGYWGGGEHTRAWGVHSSDHCD